MGRTAPEIVIPEAGQYLWDWYWDLSRSLRRTRDGAVEPIPPSEFIAWREATRTIVHPHEYAILGQMDAAYCDEMGNELADHYERMKQPSEGDES